MDEEPDDTCYPCAEQYPENECPNSKRPCGHHCNHSLSHDACCWCGKKWDESDEEEETNGLD